jgi:hypothetical protein
VGYTTSHSMPYGGVSCHFHMLYRRRLLKNLPQKAEGLGLRLRLARGRTAGALATVRAAAPGQHGVATLTSRTATVVWQPARAGGRARRASVLADLSRRHGAGRGTEGARACRTRRGRGLADRVGATCPHPPRRSLRSIVERMVFYWPGCVLRTRSRWKAPHGRGVSRRPRGWGAARGPLPWPAAGRCGSSSLEGDAM